MPYLNMVVPETLLQKVCLTINCSMVAFSPMVGGCASLELQNMVINDQKINFCFVIMTILVVVRYQNTKVVSLPFSVYGNKKEKKKERYRKIL